MILLIVRPATLSEEYAWSRDHGQEHSHPGFSKKFHF
jgi:hypothetical protein